MSERIKTCRKGFSCLQVTTKGLWLGTLLGCGFESLMLSNEEGLGLQKKLK